jgi:hypothetical protein
MSSRSRARRAEKREVIRGVIAVHVATAAAFTAFAIPFWLPASWHGGLDRFGDRHPVVEIVLGVSVLLVGCLPTAVGAFGLAVPNTEVRVNGRNKSVHTSRREALTWIAVGWAYAAIVGFAIHAAAG